jgi:hypothetical protein
MEMKMDEQSIRINPANIFGQVYKKNDKGVMYVKVYLPDLGLYINSITVRPSVNYAEKGVPWVQVPKFAVYTRWISPLEFTKVSPLWPLIHDEVLRAVDRYQHDGDDDIPEEFRIEIPP